MVLAGSQYSRATITWMVIIGALVLFSIFGRQGAPRFDDYRVYDDFLLIPPALSLYQSATWDFSIVNQIAPLHAVGSNCASKCTRFDNRGCYARYKTCTGGEWKIEGTYNSNQYGSTVNDPMWYSADGGYIQRGTWTSTQGFAGRDVRVKLDSIPTVYGTPNILTFSPLVTVSLGSCSYSPENTVSGATYGASISAPPVFHTIEYYHSRLDENLYYLTVNGQDLKECPYSEGEDMKLKITFGCYDTGRPCSASKVYEVASRPMFNCEVYDGQGLVFDVYDGGSTFWLSEDYRMSYSGNNVIKFCLNNPPKFLSESEGGITSDTRGELLAKLIQGERITVPDDQIWYVYYITDIGELSGYTKCDVGQAWNTNTRKCENIDIQVSQPVIEQIIQQEIINQTIIQKVEVSLEQPIIGAVPFTYKFFYTKDEDGDYTIPQPPLDIGYSPFRSGDLGFSCTNDFTTVYENGTTFFDQDEFEENKVPNPRASCWYSSSTFEGATQSYTHGSTASLNKYMDVLMRASGSMEDSPRRWTLDYYFSFKDLGFLDVDVVQQSESTYFKQLGKDTKVNIPVKIFYDLTKTGAPGGVIVRKKTGLFFSETVQKFDFDLDQGWNTYNYVWEPSELGANLFEIQPFVEIAGKIIYSPDYAQYVYYVRPREGQENVVDDPNNLYGLQSDLPGGSSVQDDQYYDYQGFEPEEDLPEESGGVVGTTLDGSSTETPSSRKEDNTGLLVLVLVAAGIGGYMYWEKNKKKFRRKR